MFCYNFLIHNEVGRFVGYFGMMSWVQWLQFPKFEITLQIKIIIDKLPWLPVLLKYLKSWSIRGLSSFMMLYMTENANGNFFSRKFICDVLSIPNIWWQCLIGEGIGHHQEVQYYEWPHLSWSKIFDFQYQNFKLNFI